MNEYLQRIKNAFRNGWEFVKDVRKEMKNVSWPSRSETTGTTIVVIVSVFFFGFFLYVVDILIHAGIELLFRRTAH